AAFISGTATFTGTAFVGNTANFDGGAINSQGPDVGGVADVSLVNCEFHGNAGFASTGAAVTNLFGGTMTVINCTFADNSGNTTGGLATSNSTTTVANCIFWNDAPLPITHGGSGSTTVSYSNVQGGYAGTGNIDLDPLFIDQAGGDLRLDSCSPAADFGINSAVPGGVTTDLDGNPRFANDTGVVDSAPGISPLVDRGAYERQIDSPAGSCCGTPAFLAAYGLENFSQHYIDALDTFLCAQQLYDAEDYSGAQAVLDALWAAHPTGGDDWWLLPWQPFDINLGTPPCYYGLRMLSDMTSWRVANPDAAPAPRTARLTVLIVGQSSGIEPQNVQDIINGTGIPVVHTVDPRVIENDYAVVHESLKLFLEYSLTAITQGRLDVETHILALPDLDLPVIASVTPSGTYFAGLDYSADLHGIIFSSMPQEEIEATDWWWLLYPSHVPEQYPDFEGVGFLTGGMGTGADAISPMFIIDDRWLVRKPAPLGQGEYSPVERSVYLPQWLQHEFYHHLYRTYPEFGLEDEGHQWFDLDTWPEDFVGQFEPDYYHESLYKRLHFADPGLHAALRYATADAPWDELSIDDVLSEYRREPVENPWHVGDIQLDGAQLEWLNTAGVRWDLFEDYLEGRLLTGPDCPYYNDPNGQSFDLILARDEIGDLTTDVAAFTFLGEVYERQPAPCPWDLDGSGDVGITELLDLLEAWGTDPGGPPDFDGGGVGITDLLALLAAWGPCP
ncbi:MAG: right-handed parallel beta-helix repeat-containing protein, partial [Planctomycetota bacterium]